MDKYTLNFLHFRRLFLDLLLLPPATRPLRMRYISHPSSDSDATVGASSLAFIDRTDLHDVEATLTERPPFCPAVSGEHGAVVTGDADNASL